MTISSLGPRKLALAGFFVCAGLIGFALYLQYFENLEPCPLCMLQRICFFALGILFLLAAIQGPGKLGVRIYAILEFAVAATGLGFASRHVLLQWFPPDVSACTADLFFQLSRFPVLRVVRKALEATGDCAKVDWTLFGLSIAQWSWIWFAILVVFAIWLFRLAPQASARRPG